MQRTDYTYAVQAMLMYGGNFIKSLAKTWTCADDGNRQRIEQTFAPEFRHYDEMFKEAA